MHLQPRVIVALDFHEIKQANEFVSKLNPEQCHLKIGKGLFVKYGPPLVESLINKGFKIFLDLKFHDIPNQVALACRAAADMGIWMLNVHALGGKPMMEAACEALDKSHSAKPLLIAVTILTSLNESDFQELGFNNSIKAWVQHLAQLAKAAGLDGVVCGATEASLLRKNLGSDFCLVTPGIRLPDNDYQDQKRVVTPQQAIQLGADYLVIGRSITESAEPERILEVINQTIISESNF